MGDVRRWLSGGIQLPFTGRDNTDLECFVGFEFGPLLAVSRYTLLLC